MILMVIGVAFVAIFIALEDELFDEEDDDGDDDRAAAELQVLQFREIMINSTAAFEAYDQYQRGRVDIHGEPIPKRRRSVTNFNWERARTCIFEDYTSPFR